MTRVAGITNTISMAFSGIRYIFASLFLLFIVSAVHAQELNATVEVDRSRLSGTSLTFLDNFANEIESYLGEHDWIEARFEEHEEINVTLRITLLNVDDNYNFEANLVLISRRPIYNSLQQTSLFLFNDENWSFTYSPNRGFIHDALQFDSITTLLDFYAYIILGYDFDSFSELGGTPYFNEAQNLVSLAQISSSSGWTRTSRVPRNRAQLVSDLQNPNYRGLRRAIYVYHRHGLDQFLENPDEARKQVIRSLEMIREARENTTNNLLFNTFFNAKYREIVSLFEDAPVDVRLQVYNIVSDIDQSHLSEYEKLR